jgi:hypothetical protein
LNESKRNEVYDYFPLIHEKSEKMGLSLSSYISNSPEKYLDHNLMGKYHTFIENQENHQWIKDKQVEINSALKIMSDINLLQIHERENEHNHQKLAKQINDDFLPRYHQLIEGVFYPFIFPISLDSRLKRKKGVDDLDLYNCIKELEFTQFKELSRFYNQTVRNGIAHIKVLFTNEKIIFLDRKGNREEINFIQFCNQFDALVDVCNALILAFKIFLINHQDIIRPPQFAFEEMKQELDCPWWRLTGYLESETLKGDTQLFLFVESNTNTLVKINFHALLTGVYAELMFNFYKIYFVSIDHKPSGTLGFSRLDGDILKTNRVRNSDLTSYKNVFLDGSAFVFIKRPPFKLFSKMETLIGTFRIYMTYGLKQIKSELLETLQIPDILVKDAEIHKNGFGLVLNAWVCVGNQSTELNELYLFNHRKRLIRKCTRFANTTRHNKIINILPLRFCRIAIYNEDMRIQKTKSYGLGESFVGTLGFNKTKRIKSPEISQGIIHDMKGYRIVMNKYYSEGAKSESDS